MSQESAAQLVNSVREAFGARCADLLLVGLGEEPVQGTKKFDVLEVEEGKEWEVEVEVVGGTLPSRIEPLVLAALLKMLLGREGIPSPLEFQMSEVMEELRRVGVMLTDDGVDWIISKYAALSYDKRAKGGDESEGGDGGVYSLLAAYFRGSEKKAGGRSRAQVFGSVLFEQGFVAGLRRGEVIVADIRFGRLGRITPCG
jgi:hypothetical protein